MLKDIDILLPNRAHNPPRTYTIDVRPTTENTLDHWWKLERILTQRNREDANERWSTWLYFGTSLHFIELSPSPLRPQSHEYLHSTESTTTISHYDQRIRALTSILDRQPCQPPISNIDPLDVESNVELRSYYYLATLLTTGLYDHNCAVTAILSPGLVKCIIADTGDLRHERGSLERRVHIIPEGQMDLQALGSQPHVPSVIL